MKKSTMLYGVGAMMAIGTAAAIVGSTGKKKSAKKKLKKTATKAINTVGDILDNMPKMM